MSKTKRKRRRRGQEAERKQLVEDIMAGGGGNGAVAGAGPVDAAQLMYANLSDDTIRTLTENEEPQPEEDDKVKLDGVIYTITPLEPSDTQAIEDQYLASRPNPILSITQLEGQMSDAIFDKLLDRAYKDLTTAAQVDTAEVVRWMNTREGIAYTLWMCILKNHPEFPFDKMNDIISKMGLRTLQKLADKRQMFSQQEMEAERKKRDEQLESDAADDNDETDDNDEQ